MKDLLGRLLPPFAEGPREKPRDMLYLAADRPPWLISFGVGLQHALAALMLLIYAVITGQEIGLEGDRLREFMALGILVMGFGTLLNGLTSRFSAGHLLVLYPGPVIMAVFIGVAQAAGPGAAAGGALTSGLALLVLSRFLPVLRLLFPAEVSGVLLMLLSMSLIPLGINRAFDLGNGPGNPLDLPSILIALATLGTIVGLLVWSAGRARVLALFIGAGVGLLVAILTGQFGAQELSQVATAPLLAIPGAHYRPPLPSWQAATLLPFLLVSIMVAVAAVGGGIVIDKMNDAKWCRPDLPMIGRLLNGLSLCHLLSGLTGTPTVAVSSVNLGMVHATGVAARRAGVAAGLVMMALACLPAITTCIILLPKPVIGALLLYTAAYLMVSGAELVLSRLLNARRRATVGLGLVAGAAVFMVPALTAAVPLALKPILGSGLVVGVCCAIFLNLIFRIGIAKEVACRLDGPRPAEQARRLLEDGGADWGARREVILRAILVIDEALAILRQEEVMAGPARLMARFNEETLVLTLDYPGQAIRLEADQPLDVRALLDSDQDETALDQTMAAISATLIRNLADRVSSRSPAGRGRLRLEFNH